MAFQVDRSAFDPDSGFEYYICFKPASQVDGDEVTSRISIEVAVSVSETGDIADLSFVLPKACRSDYALTYIKKDPTAVCVENRVFVALPGLSGDAVLTAPGTVELDNAGRIEAQDLGLALRGRCALADLVVDRVGRDRFHRDADVAALRFHLCGLEIDQRILRIDRQRFPVSDGLHVGLLQASEIRWPYCLA